MNYNDYLAQARQRLRGLLGRLSNPRVNNVSNTVDGSYYVNPGISNGLNLDYIQQNPGFISDQAALNAANADTAKNVSKAINKINKAEAKTWGAVGGAPTDWTNAAISGGGPGGPPPDGPGGGGGLSGLLSKLKGVDIQKMANTGLGIYQGYNLVKDINELTSNQNKTTDFVNDIKSLAYANPTIAGSLDPQSKKLLRQIQSGTYATQNPWNQVATGFGGALKSIPKAALSGLGGFLIGGMPGAAINTLGTMARGAVKGADNAQFNPQLQGLYEQLANAEADYRTSRRPSNLRQAGLQSRVARALY